MRNSRTLLITVLLILAIVGIAVPFVTGYYYTDVITMLFIDIILVSSFRLITLTGNWNLAQIPLMGVGAYSSALITGSLGWPFWLSLPLSAVVAALIGLAMSYPLARTRGFAFFIASYAAGEAVVCAGRGSKYLRRLVRVRTPPPGISEHNFAIPLPLLPDRDRQIYACGLYRWAVPHDSTFSHSLAGEPP
jgi:ABC-type branched-subunit amino acid transport system permease subunit